MLTVNIGITKATQTSSPRGISVPVQSFMTAHGDCAQAGQPLAEIRDAQHHGRNQHQGQQP